LQLNLLGQHMGYCFEAILCGFQQSASFVAKCAMTQLLGYHPFNYKTYAINSKRKKILNLRSRICCDIFNCVRQLSQSLGCSYFVKIKKT
jgi:hypothetical protein